MLDESDYFQGFRILHYCCLLSSLHVLEFIYFFRNVLGVICCIYHPGMDRPIHQEKFLNGHLVVVFGQSIKFFERI